MPLEEAAPVDCAGGDPDSVLEPVGLPEPEPEAAEPVGAEEPVAAAPVPEAGALEAAPGMATVWELGNKLAMQDCTHWENFSVASGEPSPWSHLAAHSLVATAWEELGRAMPKQAAWQVTSAGSQATAQLCWGVRVGVWVVAGALVTWEAS